MESLCPLFHPICSLIVIVLISCVKSIYSFVCLLVSFTLFIYFFNWVSDIIVNESYHFYYPVISLSPGWPIKSEIICTLKEVPMDGRVKEGPPV